MPIGQILGAIIFGFVGVYLGIILYSSARGREPKIDIWWVPKDMQAREEDKRLITGVVAFLIFVVGLIMLVMGVLALLKSI